MRPPLSLLREPLSSVGLPIRRSRSAQILFLEHYWSPYWRTYVADCLLDCWYRCSESASGSDHTEFFPIPSALPTSKPSRSALCLQPWLQDTTTTTMHRERNRRRLFDSLLEFLAVSCCCRRVEIAAAMIFSSVINCRCGLDSLYHSVG